MNGVIVISKPQKFTSFDVVAIMRGCFKTKKIGHTGTLDPMATGVLPILVGSATKAASILPDKDKSYTAGFRLGVTSDTLDIWGNCSEQKAVSVSREVLEEALKNFRGNIMQTPPMYSALKVNGQKLCDLARKGIEVERKPRPITVSRLELTEFSGQSGVIEVDCSSGTYIRSLIDDIGAALGCGAVMTGLVRTRACGYSVYDAIPLETAKEMPQEELIKRLKPVDSLFADFPGIRLDGEQQRLYLNGVRLDKNRLHGDFDEGMYRVFGNKFFGVAKIENGELISVKRFNNGD